VSAIRTIVGAIGTLVGAIEILVGAIWKMPGRLRRPTVRGSVGVSLQITNQSAQSREEPPGELVNRHQALSRDVPLQLSGSERIPQLVHGAAGDDQEAAEFAVGISTEALGDVSTDRLDRVLGLRAKPLVLAVCPPRGQLEHSDTNSIGQLPRYQLRRVPRASHAATARTRDAAAGRR